MALLGRSGRQESYGSGRFSGNPLGRLHFRENYGFRRCSGNSFRGQINRFRIYSPGERDDG